jgi:TonB-linked SusC/RagA family outer membrane protein
MLTGAVAFAQNKQITGTVTDTKGEALIGASISIQGSSVGTAADVDGNFSLMAKPGDVLSVEYLGYQTKTVTVGTASEYLIQLLDEETALGEVVVVGYGTLEKRQITNSITSLAARDLPSGIGGSTIVSAMQGKVGNLIMTEASGERDGAASPNAESPTLQLRGMASYNASKAPLVVIDGMPGGDIRSVVQEDIQSIDILRDAGAGAIYGTRATGGVIIITTKKAQEGKLRLSYTGEAIYKQVYGKPRVLNAQEFRDNLVTLTGATDFDKANNPNYDPEHPFSTDWWDQGLADNPWSYRHVMSFNGGSREAKIYATFMYEDTKSVIIGDTRKDLSGRINGNFKFFGDWLDVNTHIAYRQADRNKANVNPASLMWNNPTRDPDNKIMWPRTNGNDEWNTEEYKEIIDFGTDKWFRPDVEFILNVLPVNGLTAHYSLAYDNSQWVGHKYEPSTMTKRESTNASGQGTAYHEFSTTDMTNFDGYLSYVRKFGTDHDLNATAGYSYFSKEKELFNQKNYGFSDDAIALWTQGNGTWLKNPPGGAYAGSAEMESKREITEHLISFFGRAHYSYKDKYLASATFRRDGSSKFGYKNRYGNFYQMSAAWRISNEKFMANINAINDLKFRVAYGVTGNEGFPSDKTITKLAPSSSLTMLPGTILGTKDPGWVTSFVYNNNPNPFLKWEEKHEFNIGVDYELLNRRLFGKFDLYQRKVEGLLYEVPGNATDSRPDLNKMVNVGTLNNQGWEIEIGGKIVDTKDWQYTTKLNVSHNTTKVGTMFDGAIGYDGGSISNRGTVHKFHEDVTVGSFYIYKYAGVNPEFYQDADGNYVSKTPGKELIFQKDADGNNTVPFPAGTPLIYDAAGNIINPVAKADLTDANKYYIGNYTPKAIFGWSHDLSYKNLSLGMTLTSWVDFDIYNSNQQRHGFLYSSNNVLIDAIGKNKDITTSTPGTYVSSYFLEDGTFLKIQNITLAYRLNTQKYLKYMSSARLYLTVNNVHTFTKYSGFDPEVDISGWENGRERSYYPLARNYAFGIQLTF